MKVTKPKALGFRTDDFKIIFHCHKETENCPCEPEGICIAYREFKELCAKLDKIYNGHDCEFYKKNYLKERNSMPPNIPIQAMLKKIKELEKSMDKLGIEPFAPLSTKYYFQEIKSFIYQQAKGEGGNNHYYAEVLDKIEQYSCGICDQKTECLKGEKYVCGVDKIKSWLQEQGKGEKKPPTSLIVIKCGN